MQPFLIKYRWFHIQSDSVAYRRHPIDIGKSMSKNRLSVLSSKFDDVTSVAVRREVVTFIVGQP
ncbi:hypothetical protein GCM10027569_71750 [Flindersiella endophytica]